VTLTIKYSGMLARRTPVDELCGWLAAFAANLPAGVGNGEIVKSSLAREQIRERILAMESAMRSVEASGGGATSQLDELMPLKHLFAPGAYGRQITVPAGHWVIGKIHKHAHLNFVMKGRCVVLTEEGPMVIQAPFSFVSSVGTKRVVLALEELVWATVHLTDKTDLEQIEDEVIAKSYTDVPLMALQKVEVIQ
jgi:hypothetical protein